MSGIFESLAWADGKINPSGIKNEIFFAPKSDIKTFPPFNAAPANADENVAFNGDYEMQVGKTFQRLYSTQGKGKVDWESIGEKDCKMFMNKGMFKFPDLNNAAKSLAKSCVNANMVFIVPLPHETEKRYVVLGDDYWDTTVNVKGDSGDAPGSDKGTTVEVEAPSTTPLPNYTGILVLPDGSLDCATGVFTPTV
ncbi:MAG: hypothetical protein HQ522_07815 [Bacteroidetes bacterium]|nr:hypothetical protein [Bacteroidota bacterium]